MTLDFKEMEGSMYNTPPCWSIYVCGLVFKHLLAAGGLPGVKANNDTKAKLVYDAIEGSNGFYASPVEPSVRSNMNIPFTIPSSPNLEKAFVSEASEQNMVRPCAILKITFLASIFDLAAAIGHSHQVPKKSSLLGSGCSRLAQGII